MSFSSACPVTVSPWPEAGPGHWGSVSTWLGGRGSDDLDSELPFPAARLRFLVQCLEVHAPSPEDSHLGHGWGCCCITDPVVNSERRSVECSWNEPQKLFASPTLGYMLLILF